MQRVVFPTKESPFKGRRTSSWSEVIFSGYKDTKRERKREKEATGESNPRWLVKCVFFWLVKYVLGASYTYPFVLIGSLVCLKTVAIGQRDKIGLQNVNVII